MATKKNYHKNITFSADDKRLASILADPATDEREADSIVANGVAEIRDRWSDEQRASRARRSCPEVVEIHVIPTFGSLNGVAIVR